MHFRTLVARGLRYYWHTNLAVMAGVAIAVAVLAGALIVGDSVRGSLRDLALERIGRTDLAVTAPQLVRDALAGELAAQPAFRAAFDSAAPLIVLEGFVTHQTSGRRAGDVQVYGVDERFWRFHGLDDVPAPADRDALASPALAAELNLAPGDTLLVRLEKPSDIPVESLYGRKDEAGRTVRLEFRETLARERLGEFSLRLQQGSVRALFVPLARLQGDLELGGRANAILVGGAAPGAADDDGQAGRLLDALHGAFSLEDAGVHVRWLETCACLSIGTASGIVSPPLENAILGLAADRGLEARPVLTYLVNTIRSGDREIPYSLVTAIQWPVDSQGPTPETALPAPRAQSPEPASIPPAPNAQRPEPASIPPAPNAQRPAPIVLNAWAARDLGVGPGAAVELEYYYWLDEGRLETRMAPFTVAAVVPLEGPAADPDLTPDYPGITDAENVATWDPPFPMDLSRVRQVDEDYWDAHRTTPKAFVRYEDGAVLWATRYGRLTSMRLFGAAGPDAADVAAALREALHPLAFGVALQPVRAQSLTASRGATDFGEYFAYFSAFLVASALLLAALFFRLGVDQRLREIGALRAAGFELRRIRSLFLAEGLVLAAAGTLFGLAGAVGYAWIMMYGLRTWWVEAVGTTALSLHVTPWSLLAGAIGGMAVAAACIAGSLRALGYASPRSLLAGSGAGAGRPGGGRRAALAALSSAAAGAVLLAGAALGWLPEAGAFFGGGSLLLVAALFALAARLHARPRQTLHGHGLAGVARLGFRNIAARPARTVLCAALVAFATFVIVSVEAFRRDGAPDPRDPQSGTGGYPLLATSLLPIYHHPGTPEGRDELNLFAPAGLSLDEVGVARFRVRPGDDASCLNLYRPQNPRILGVPGEILEGGRFAFRASLAETPEERANPWLLLERRVEGEEDVIPVIADASSLTYVLHLGLGDELILGAGDRPLRLRVVGALADSIFQGELLMSEARFREAFPGHEGHRFFLIDAPPGQEAGVAALLEDRLADYGVDVRTSADRLAAFHRVENTYLSTFQLLGGLGLLLGTLGLAVVLLRNVLERRRELALLRAVGYDGRDFSVMVVAENAALLVIGLGAGTLCALLAIAPALAERAGGPAASALALPAGVFLVGLLASIAAAAIARRMHLLGALREEG